MSVRERPLREHGAEMIDTALVQVGFCDSKAVSKSFIGRNGLSEVRI